MPLPDTTVQEEASAGSAALCSGLAPAPGAASVSVGCNTLTGSQAPMWKEQVNSYFA